MTSRLVYFAGGQNDGLYVGVGVDLEKKKERGFNDAYKGRWHFRTEQPPYMALLILRNISSLFC